MKFIPTEAFWALLLEHADGLEGTLGIENFLEPPYFIDASTGEPLSFWERSDVGEHEALLDALGDELVGHEGWKKVFDLFGLCASSEGVEPMLGLLEHAWLHPGREAWKHIGLLEALLEGHVEPHVIDALRAQGALPWQAWREARRAEVEDVLCSVFPEGVQEIHSRLDWGGAVYLTLEACVPDFIWRGSQEQQAWFDETLRPRVLERFFIDRGHVEARAPEGLELAIEPSGARSAKRELLEDLQRSILRSGVDDRLGERLRADDPVWMALEITPNVSLTCCGGSQYVLYTPWSAHVLQLYDFC